ncbi:MAG: hypothetical protein QHJ81_05580 [Anaerolineae bacterium]|nr:hypothetical protein [Anaerolineae bacterium]
MKQSKSVALKERGGYYALTIDETRLRQAPFTIERDGQPVAAVVPVDEYQEFMAWREHIAHTESPAKSTTLQQDALNALQKERAAFLRLKEQLLRTHSGQFVAILNGEIIDSDTDDRALTRRVYAEHGYVPIYIDEVTKEPPLRRILSPKRVVS